MAVPSPPIISAPPTPPSRTNPASFAINGDAFLGWFPTAWQYLSELVAWLTNRANEVEANSNAAVQAASTASAVANSSAVQNAAANATTAATAAAAAQGFAALAQATNPDAPLRLNPKTITATTVIPTGYNAASTGPLAVADGVNVTVSDHSTWSIT